MGRKIYLLGIGVGAVVWILSSTFVSAANLVIKDIMVTQGVQDTANSIPLVSGRWTAVRVRVESPEPRVKVTGTLKLMSGGVTVEADVLPMNPGFKPPKPIHFDWEEEDHTLNFELEAVIPPNQPAKFEVRVEAMPTVGVLPPLPGADSDSRVVKCIDVSWPEILYVRVDYDHAGSTPTNSQVKAGVGDAFLRATWPLRDDVPFYEEGANSPYPFMYDSGILGEIEDWEGPGGDVNVLLSELTDIRLNWVDGDADLADCAFVYGWVHGNAVPNNGWSGDRVGFGTNQHARKRRTFAHEMGHMVGRSHPEPDELTDMYGWDVGNRLGESSRVRPKGLYDLMVPKRTADETWVSSNTYKKLIEACRTFPLPPAGPPMPDDAFKRDVLVVKGVIGSDGQSAKLDPVFRYPWGVSLIPEPPEGDYLVEVEGENAAAAVVRRRFTGLIHSDDERTRRRSGFFCVTVPFDGQVKEVRIRKKDAAQDAAPLNRKERAKDLPTVTFGDFAPGGVLKGKDVLSWKVGNLKTDGIVHHLLVSLDGGKRFFPLKVGLKESSFEVQWNRLAGIKSKKENLEKKIVVRLISSDGLNTIQARISDLSIQKD